MPYTMEDRKKIVKSQQRRHKTEEESNFWQQVFYQSFEESQSVSRAVGQADSALENFRARFPLMDMDDDDIDSIFRMEVGIIE